jgi:hypothetical protein
LVEETGVTGENHESATSHWQTLSHNVVSSTPHLSVELELTTLVMIVTDCIVSCKSNYHTITTITVSVILWLLIYWYIDSYTFISTFLTY